MKSIRRFLLINLLLAIITMTLITAIGNYVLDEKDIRRHLDTILSQATLSFNALLGDDFNVRDLERLQSTIDTIPTQAESFQQRGTFDPHVADKYQFQVWDNKGKLLLHSSNAPMQKMSDGKEGFDNKRIEAADWRSFTKVNSKLGISVIVAERYERRSLLAHRIAEDDIYIMLLTYPLVGILIWLIIGSGLRSIDRVADEVSHRLPNYLDPVDSTNVPDEIKPLVDELNKLFLRLQQALDREKRFTGDAAHELRTPLAALKTQAQVALKTSDEGERKTMLRNVIVGVDRATHVVQQLMTMSRLGPEANMLVDAMPVNIAKLASEIIAQLVPYAIEKHIEIELVCNEKDYTVMGNITALSILIRNLVDNAIRYTPEGGAIQVLLNQKDKRINLHVIDNGPGIPAELRARVFERFFRVLGNKSPGSGLGLAIVQQIADLHDAKVKLGPPASGKGLEVEVSFPGA